MTLSAVLLAGGESRRMGEDKATIVFRRQPLWQRQLELLRGLGPEKIFVSAEKNLRGCRTMPNCFWTSRHLAVPSVA